MKKLTFLIILFAFIFSSCEKVQYPDLELTVNDLYDYCATDGEYPCSVPLNHEGDLITIIGYYDVSNHEFNSSENKFRFFDSPIISSIATEIEVMENSESVFKKITEIIDENNSAEYIKLKVSGKIIGHDLPTNGACSRGVFTEINNSSDIRSFN